MTVTSSSFYVSQSHSTVATSGNVLTSARSHANNIYIGIRRTLLDDVDPVLNRAAERLEKIYRETFWAIPNAFEFGQACLALAKRGSNINQITLYLGPGGVGLSKYTSHLEAMLGEDSRASYTLSHSTSLKQFSQHSYSRSLSPQHSTAMVAAKLISTADSTAMAAAFRPAYVAVSASAQPQPEREARHQPQP